MTNTAYTKSELLFRLFYFVLGTGITAIGCAVFILSETGTDPFGTLMVGVARTFKISNGVAHIAINATFIAIILFVDRKYIRIGTFAALFATGPMIDFASKLLSPFISAELPYLLRISLVFVSCIIIGFGFSGVINASVGMGGNDLQAIIISDRTHIQFRWVRIAVDGSFMVVGFLLGGTIGLGTVISVLLTGPIVQAFMPATAKILAHLLRRLLHK